MAAAQILLMNKSGSGEIVLSEKTHLNANQELACEQAHGLFAEDLVKPLSVPGEKKKLKKRKLFFYFCE